ncbi:MAG: SMC-Scp complex subunit ScpB [Candidatus Geothermarchaeales archaeon]
MKSQLKSQGEEGGETTQPGQYYPLLDALFFSASTPLNIDQLKRAMRLEDRAKTVSIVEEYMKHFNSFHTGVKISKTSGKIYLMHVNPKYVERIRRYMRPPPLTDKQLKTLAFIYKNQPVRLRKVATVFGSRAYRDVRKLYKLRLVTKKKKGVETFLRVRDTAKYMIRLG